MLSYTDTSVTCMCDVMHSSSQQQQGGMRRLLSSSQSYNFTEPAGYSVSYVSMLESTTSTFASTIETADNLNASTVTKGWRAIATLGALAGAILFGLLWSHYSDNQAKKVQPVTEASPSSHALVPSTLEAAKVRAKNVRNGVNSNANKDGSNGTRAGPRYGRKAKKALVNAELALVESLPKALSSRTFSDRFLEEVKQHHRWLGIVFHFSDTFPRVLRVISLATNAIVMLFIQSITYNLTNPDDGSCELLTTPAACLQPKSPFATGESKCAWISHSSSATAGSCVFIQPDNSFRIILFVAIFCAIVTTPIALTVDWIVCNVLSAPTESASEDNTTTTSPENADKLLQAVVPGSSSSKTDSASAAAATNKTGRPGQMQRQSSTSMLVTYFGMFSSEKKMKDDKAILATSRAELLMLSMKLKKYREMLRPDELAEFNGKSLQIVKF